MTRAVPGAADPLELDAVGQAELVRRGALSPPELLELAIARIEKRNPALNAVIHEHFERARREAAGTLPDGPFRGVPFLLKDLGVGNRAGDPIHWGTRFLRDAGYRAPTTSYLVEKFRAAGLVIAGRTNVPELGAWTTTEPAAYGPTRNPWDASRSSGGSSGGAAAAVAARMVAAAHASDGGGSIRNPASQCGLVGLKPSRGRISLGPDIGEAWAGMTFEFAVTRTVRDTAALLDAVAENMPGDPYTARLPGRPYAQEVGAPPGALRVGIWADLPGPVHAECAGAAHEAARQLAGLGHRVEPARPAALGDESLMEWLVRVIASSQARIIDGFGRVLGRMLGPDDMDCDNWAVTELGQKVSASQYLEAVEQLSRFSRRVAAWWADGFDLLVTPTIPELPPPLGELVPDPAQPLKGFLRSGALTPFLIPFNVTGQPAISLPLSWSASGLPIGVQLVAAFGREDVLIRVAAQLEERAPWSHRRPPLAG
ncbi:MAG TPA: amidase family protein [Myxococcota bacterium]|nr:amidase family protein [Myxococcota bacterium]